MTRTIDELRQRKDLMNDSWSSLPYSQILLSRVENREGNPRFSVSNNQEDFLIKFSDSPNGPSDICEREETISHLGALLGIPVVEAITTASHAHFRSIVDSLHRDGMIVEKCVFMKKLSGMTLEQRRISPSANEVGNLLAFMHWIGDEDRGLGDVFFSNGHLTLIDFGLSGPCAKYDGTDYRGAHPAPSKVGLTGNDLVMKCPPGKISFVKFALMRVDRSSPEIVEPAVLAEIEAIDEHILEKIIELGGIENRSYFKKELVRRSKVIRNDYAEWLVKAQELLEPR